MDAREPTALTPLPSELLADIFEWYVEMDGSPWRLVEVCRQWNEIAVFTGRLWRSITILHSDFEHPSHTYDSNSAYQICCHPTDVQTALNRAASSPLDLMVTFSSSASYSESGKRITKSDANILILLASIVSRCESLFLKTSAHGPRLYDLVEPVDLPAFVRLRSLTIGPSWRNRTILNQMLDALQKAPRGIDELRLESPEIYPDLSEYPIAAQKIRHLVLLSTYPSVTELAKLLRPLQNLVDMRSTSSNKWRNLIALDLVANGRQLLPSMAKCILHRTVLVGWGGLQLRSLRYLQIEDCDIAENPYSIELLALETLVIRQEWWAAAFTPLLCPELNCLTLCGGPENVTNADLDILQTFSSDPRQPSPRFLSIHVRADDEILISCLGYISSLEELEMVVDSHLRSDTLSEKLNASLSDTAHDGPMSGAPSWGPLFPSLRKVTMRYQSQAQADTPSWVGDAKVSWRKAKRDQEALSVLHRESGCTLFVKVPRLSMLNDDDRVS